MIIETTAVVYWGGNRRWLTLDGACNAEARAKLRTKCECDSAHSSLFREGIEPPYTCGYHQEGRYDKFVRRLSAIYKRAFKAGLPPIGE